MPIDTMLNSKTARIREIMLPHDWTQVARNRGDTHVDSDQRVGQVRARREPILELIQEAMRQASGLAEPAIQTQQGVLLINTFFVCFCLFADRQYQHG